MDSMAPRIPSPCAAADLDPQVARWTPWPFCLHGKTAALLSRQSRLARFNSTLGFDAKRWRVPYQGRLTVRNANGVLKQSPRLAHSAYLGSRVRTRCGGNATPLPTRRHSVVAGRIFRLPPSGGWKAARTRTLESVRDVVVQPFQAAGWRSFPAPQRTAGCSGPWWWFQDAPIVAALVILSFILRTAQYRHDETAVNIAPLQSTTNRSAEPLFGPGFRG